MFIQANQESTMSNSTFSATATSSDFKPAADSNGRPSLLRGLFQATPLYIFATALKAAFQKPSQR